MVWNGYRSWQANIPVANPLLREQAILLQWLLLVMMVASIIGIPLSFSAASEIDQIVGVISSLLQLLLLIVAIVVLRRGLFSAAVILTIVNLIGFAALNMIPTGLEGSRAIFFALAIPIVLAGLLGGRRLLAFASALTIILVITVAALGIVAPTLVGYSRVNYDPRLTSVAYVVIAIVMTVLIDRFGRVVHNALVRARTREQELDALRLSLEQQIAERTADLRATVDRLSASQATVSQLGALVLPVLPSVLVTPLTGVFDSVRIAALRQKILAAVTEQRAHTVIFDITGVDIVDQHVVAELLQVTMAVQLLGAESIVVGIRPEVAMVLARLENGLQKQRIYATLQEAVQALSGQSAAIGKGVS